MQLQETWLTAFTQQFGFGGWRWTFEQESIQTEMFTVKNTKLKVSPSKNSKNKMQMPNKSFIKTLLLTWERHKSKTGQTEGHQEKKKKAKGTKMSFSEATFKNTPGE